MPRRRACALALLLGAAALAGCGGGGGAVHGPARAAYIAKCKNGTFKYTKIERPVENIQVYGDTVVVTGHTKMDVIADGKPKVLSSRYTDVWIRSPKGWQMVVWQSTPLPAPLA